jgi:hypothetical protein
VEPYVTPATADPFVAARTCFETLVDDLAAPAAAALTHHDLENLLDTRGRELLRQLLQDHLDLRALREERALRTDPGPVPDVRGCPHAHVETGHHRVLATVFGTVVVRRCALRARAARNCYPADAALSLPAGRHSHGLRRLAALEAVRGSFDAATAAVTRRCGKVAGKRQVEQLVLAAATDVDAFYRARIPVPATAEVLLVLSVDGKGIVMRPDALRPATAKAAANHRSVFRTRLTAGEKPARKRMATLGTVYDAVPAVRRPHDVIAVPGGRSGDRELRPGPRARGKWLTGSVATDARDVVGQVFEEADSRDPGHQRCWVVLVDGARHQLDLIRAEAARRGVAVHIVVDLIHCLEYLWKAAFSLHAADDPAAEDWVAAHALALLAGHAARAAKRIEEQADAAGLRGERRHGADACVSYLRAKQEYLRYDLALAAGWPIATGVIEGACRHLIADRLDITGARWGLAGAEAVLKLRAVESNGDFDDYFRYHLTREHQRVHQDKYALTA